MKRLNPRRVKIHRNYTVEEAAMLLGVHKNTVRAWFRAGLDPIDHRRPTLILGRQLSSFLHARREARRQRCRAGQFYCVRCRAPRTSAASKAWYLPITTVSGNLSGICSDCGTRMYRRVALHKIAVVAGDLHVTMPQAQQHIDEGASPSQHSDLPQEASDHAHTQSGK